LHSTCIAPAVKKLHIMTIKKKNIYGKYIQM